jgi:hypothetical protein
MPFPVNGVCAVAVLSSRQDAAKAERPHCRERAWLGVLAELGHLIACREGGGDEEESIQYKKGGV